MAAAFALTCTLFRPWPKNTPRGLASIRLTEIDLTIHDVAIHEKGCARWAQLPAKPQVDGALVKDADGKIQYVKMMDFGSHAQRDAFSVAAIAAVLEHPPNAFGGDAA
jgi:hypothetical protein